MEQRFGSCTDDPEYLIGLAADEVTADRITELSLRRAAELGYLALASTVAVLVGHDIEDAGEELRELDRIASRHKQFPNLAADYRRIRKYLHGATYHNKKYGTRQDVILAIGEATLLIKLLLSNRKARK
jgi:hypothetical protein